MATTLDRNFFTQVGLDSGALTMLGVIVHTFGEPGEYRGLVLSDDNNEATFYVSVDRECAVAGVNIDLASLAGTAPTSATGSEATGPRAGCGCGQASVESGAAGPRYVVHPKGYAVFHVSGGPGGYAVNVRKAVEDPEVRPYDSRTLVPGDIFSAILVRPGHYSIRNALNDARAQVMVSYPGVGRVAYRPPAPEDVEVGTTITPARINLKPMQALNFNVSSDARLVIELEEADDGPRAQEAPTR
jgi:hypothetical protein